MIPEIQNAIPSLFSEAVPGVIQVFHSWLLQQLPFSEFLKVHPQLKRIDTTYLQNIEKLFSVIAIQISPPRSMILIGKESFFLLPRQLMNDAFLVGYPLESLKYVSRTLELISDVFKFEFQSSPQFDEFDPLFNYTLLSLRHQSLYSYCNYLDHFLSDLPKETLKFFDRNSQLSLSKIVRFMQTLDHVLSEG